MPHSPQVSAIVPSVGPIGLCTLCGKGGFGSNVMCASVVDNHATTRRFVSATDAGSKTQPRNGSDAGEGGGGEKVNRLWSWFLAFFRPGHEQALGDLKKRCPETGSLWRHRKGGLYLVVHGCLIEATLTPAVAYQHVTYACDFPFHLESVSVPWIRPLDEFLDGRFVRESLAAMPAQEGAGK